MVNACRFDPGDLFVDPTGLVYRVEPHGSGYSLVVEPVDQIVNTVRLTFSETVPQQPTAWRMDFTNQVKLPAEAGWRFVFVVTRSGNIVAPATIIWKVSSAGEEPATIDDFASMTGLPTGSVELKAGDTTADINLTLVRTDTPFRTFTVDLTVDGETVLTSPVIKVRGTDGLQKQKEDVPPRKLVAPTLHGLEMGAARPGVAGIDYQEPSDDLIDTLLDKGYRAFHLPVLWERIQPRQYAALNLDEMRRIDRIVHKLTNVDCWVIIDLHNFMSYYGQLVGDMVPTAAYVDLWRKLASRYKALKQVVFCLMYGPTGIQAPKLRDIYNDTAAAIRDEGAFNWLLSAGSGQGEGRNWLSLNTALAGIKDDRTVLAVTYDDQIKQWAGDVTRWAADNDKTMMLLAVPPAAVKNVGSLQDNIWRGITVIGIMSP